ncbi:MAG: hypothetical protein ACI9KE_005020 [Polyangiales bacterium]
MRAALVLSSIACAALIGCDGTRQRECDFVAGDVIATTGPEGFSALVMERSEDGVDAYYSSADGLHRVALRTTLDGDAPRVLSRLRLGAPCDTLSVTRQEDVVFLVCGRRPIEAKDAGGTMHIYRISGEDYRSVQLPWPIGRDHKGLALAVVNQHLELVFHDGRIGEWKVWHAEICVVWEHASLCNEEARLLSAASLLAGAPSLSEIRGERFVAWTESTLSPGTEIFVGSVLVSRSDAAGPIGARPQRSAEVIYDRSLPFVAAGVEHPVLFFRDSRRPHRRPHVFAQELRNGASAMRVGRSNDQRAARAFPCGDSLAVVTPRSYSRNDILVGVHLLDEELEGRVAEQQVYEWAARFVDVAGVCRDELLWLAVAEENRLDGRDAALHVTALSCE